MKSVALALSSSIILTTMVAAIVQTAHSQTSSGNTDWVTYTAVYHETVSNPGQPQRSLVTTESRSSDGSVLTISQENGHMVGGKLWKGCGSMYALDFNSHHAIYQRNAPRVHAEVPQVAPMSSDVIAGVSCSVYPLKMQGSTGSFVCVDTSRDILVKEEVHLSQPNGKTDYIKEMTSFDPSKPRPEEKNGLPAGFDALNPSGQSSKGCS